MFENRPVIVVIPAGRRRYMPLVMHYIYQHKGLIDKVILWCNTQDSQDRDHLYNMAAMDPAFVSVQTIQDGPLGKVGEMCAIRSFYTREMDPQAVYLRIDDDICWMHKDAIPAIVKFRLDHPDYFCLTANMVNSGLCSHIHNRMGLHHKHTVKVPWTSAGGPLHDSAALATFIHDGLLNDIAEPLPGYPTKLERWRCFEYWELWEYPRFGIAFTAYLGNDLLDVQGKWEGPENTDEEFFTVFWPAKVHRMNCICGKALVSHYAYGPQRNNGLEVRVDEVAPGLKPADIYPRYKKLAGVE